MAAPAFNPIALIAGSAIDFGFTFAAGLALTLVYGAGDAAAYLLPMLSIGALGTVLGAAFAARYARRNPLAHGLGVGAISTSMGLIAQLGQGGMPWPWDWIGIAAALPASLLGALLGSTRD